jgi:uncharacterized cupredoxin-like copper-binding protein
MIVRFWLLFGLVLIVGAIVLQVPLAPPPFQLSARSALDGYREAGLMPAPGALTMSKEIGHEVFEVPEEDAQHRGEEAAMEGMAMGEMKEDEHAEAPMEGMAMGEMEEGGHSGGGLMVMPAKMAGMASRVIEIEMREWGFSPPNITVMAGEVIHFKVRNRGNMPHEFMFMPPEGMNAVNYRLERADWSLTEHEASFERAVVMPGDGFETVIKIAQPGVWMFMCMFPYHMQLGMMGMMMTEGASMDGMKMGDMGNMKM